jgi:tRNA (adenine57-N1/adenine58-N1)-methyltransferase
VTTGADRRRGPLRPGDQVQLTDPKGKMHTITLTAGKQFHTHKGILEHDSLIDGPRASS